MNSTTWFILWLINFGIIILLFCYTQFLSRRINNLSEFAELQNEQNTLMIEWGRNVNDFLDDNAKHILSIMCCCPYFYESCHESSEESTDETATEDTETEDKDNEDSHI